MRQGSQHIQWQARAGFTDQTNKRLIIRCIVEYRRSSIATIDNVVTQSSD